MLLLVAAAGAAPRIALDVSAGLQPDMAGLGGIITQSGDIALAETTLASAVYSTDTLLVSDQDSQTLWAASDQTGSLFSVLSEEPVVGSALLGIELGGRVRIERADSPVFFQVGALYSTRLTGGTQSRTLGSIAADSAQLSAILTASGLDPADHIHGHLATTFDASWVEIPLSVGLRTRQRALSQFYGSGGLSLMRGGYRLTIDADEHYASALTTHIDTDAGTATSRSPGAVRETLDFTVAAAGFNYGLGLQVGVSERAAVFFELNTAWASDTATAPLSEAGSQLLSAAQEDTDAVWFSSISRSVTLTGAAVRVGVRAYIR